MRSRQTAPPGNELRQDDLGVLPADLVDRPAQENCVEAPGRRDTRTGQTGSTLEAKKSALVRKAAALASELFDPAKRSIAARLIAEFYEHVPPADVADRTPRNLYGAAVSLWRLAERRRPGQAKVRVYNPDPVADCWSSPHTIVEIINDDMPFLVDSVTGTINASNRVVHLIIHPILTVGRSPDGRLLDLLDPAAPQIRESWMQIEITPESDRADLARLTQTLSSVLADVRAEGDHFGIILLLDPRKQH